MADFAPNWTPRFKVRYSVLGLTHTIQWRLPRAADPGDWSAISAKFGLFLDDMANKLAESFTILDAVAAEVDSDVFLPVAAPTFGGGEVDESSAAVSQKAYYAQFVGRGADGGKASFYLYGYVGNPVTEADDRDFRVYATEDASFAAAITRLDETSPALGANDGSVVNWYEYVNTKYHDYWAHRIRRG